MAKRHKRGAATRARVAKWRMAAPPHRTPDWAAGESIMTALAALLSSETSRPRHGRLLH
ncbi:hypothetical protein PAXRUDRAFT_830301 [Paxillus rubicundulus Ve08.2h10]|uniref:Uncharacterized protein n=1 Tax=Paxillus rubicundulus Ve08.2h10 TaxID=930991 RepID=A0A0D0E4C0_9AGAM|nr:hypothetical protein PAXRUDRAFT_830301 [Paxillus rubicundulus Ve08.2h10]